MYYDILKCFYEFDDYETHNTMKNNNHHKQNFYFSDNHMENDTWTHTMLCLNHFIQFNNKEYVDEDIPKSIFISILCHDIGKCYTRNINYEKQKVTFYNHAEKSIHKTIEFLFYLKDKIRFNDFEKVVGLVLPAVANHLHLYNKTKNKHLLFNNDPDLYEVCKNLAICDNNGSISPKDKFHLKYGDTHFETIDFKMFDRNIHIYCGLPGSGKDFLAEKTGLPILSFDDIRVEEYKKHNDINDLTEKEIYEKAFTYCNDQKIDLMKLLVRKSKQINGEFCVCNTNLSKKSRKVLINSLGKANYYCHYIVSNMKDVINRNEKRSSKTVPFLVILRMSKNQCPPTIREGFNEIDFIVN